MEQSNDYYFRKKLDDGRLVCVVPLTYGRARIGIGDEECFYDVW